ALAARLGLWVEAPAPVIYRLLRELRSQSRVSYTERTGSGPQHRVTARRQGKDRVVWQVEAVAEIEGPQILPYAAAPFGYLRRDAEGRILHLNPQLATWLGRAPTWIEEVLGAPAAGHEETRATLATDPPRPVQILRRAAPDRIAEGEEDVFLFPAAPSRPEPPLALTATVMDDLPVAILGLTLAGEVHTLNHAATHLLGPEIRPGTKIDTRLEGIGTRLDERIRRAAAASPGTRTDFALRPRGGADQFLQCSLVRIEDAGTPGLLAVLLDATELKTLEQQFVQSQKMQAVGQLAGGVAHDFNNLLTAIAGHCDLLLMRHEAGDSDHGDLMQIRQNANRATTLVRQLLAFSRKQTLRPKVVHLPTVLTELAHLLNRLLGEKVALRLDHGEEIPPVLVDAQQLEQVIMNLVVNARDAMPEGGEVAIRTSRTRLETELRRDRARVPAGDYALIEVTDTGVGIPPDQLGKIFEPFYTTKRVGEGTGLGLSTAYGIVKQTGGFIFADSEPGQGTVFSIYLPPHDGDMPEEEPRAAERANPADLTGRGVVLLVEDEAPVRSFAARALRLRGYEVIEAEDAEAAVEHLADPDLAVDVLLTDVVMPGIDGPTLVKKAREDRPDLRVLFVSGYAEDVVGENPIDLPRAAFLPKPFTLGDLHRKVKEMLES
ncbi:MAG: ATP-binding protein, partial [Pseudomonadota bacterium]